MIKYLAAWYIIKVLLFLQTVLYETEMMEVVVRT